MSAQPNEVFPKEIDAESRQQIAKAIEWGHDLAAVKIATDDEYEGAAGTLRAIKGGIKKLDDKRRSLVDPLNATVKNINDMFREPLDRLRAAEGHIKREAGRYLDAKEAEQRRLQAEADERARREAERLEKRAEKAEAKGQDEKAEALREQADMTTAPVVNAAPPKVAGVSSAAVYSCDPDVDIRALCAAVAAGTVPPIAVTPNMKFLNQQAKSLKEHFAIPGCKVKRERSMRAVAG